MMRFGSIQVTNMRFKSSQIYISGCIYRISWLYYVTHVRTESNIIYFYFSYTKKFRKKNIIVFWYDWYDMTGMIYGLKQEHMN